MFNFHHYYSSPQCHILICSFVFQNNFLILLMLKTVVLLNILVGITLLFLMVNKAIKSSKKESLYSTVNAFTVTLLSTKCSLSLVFAKQTRCKLLCRRPVYLSVSFLHSHTSFMIKLGLIYQVYKFPPSRVNAENYTCQCRAQFIKAVFRSVKKCD